MSNGLNAGLGHGVGNTGNGHAGHGGNNRLFDFPSVSAGIGGHHHSDWGLGLISNQQSLYGSLAQQ